MILRKLKTMSRLTIEDWREHKLGWTHRYSKCFINPFMVPLFDGVTLREFKKIDTEGHVGSDRYRYTHTCLTAGKRWSFHEDWFVPESEEILDEELFDI